MAGYKIEINIRPLLETAKAEAAAAIYPVVRQAVGDVATGIRTSWQSAVFRAIPASSTWAIQRRNEAVDSITVTFPGPFSAIVASSNQAVQQLEEGTPARDLKRMLTSSSRTRASKQGKKYLIIPMHHGSPGAGALAPAMPKSAYLLASHMQPSTIAGKGLRVNAHGDVAPQNRYLWGGRLQAGLVPKLRPSHRTDPLAGMVRMNTSTPGKKSSAFLTFRVMHQDSNGWIIPAKPGQYILKGIAADAGQMLEGRIQQLLQAIGT